MIRRKVIARDYINSEYHINSDKDSILIGVISDTHIGHGENMEMIKFLYEESHRRGADYIVHCGDLFDGSITLEKDFPEKVSKIFVDVYPESNIPTLWLGGNHDAIFFKMGFDLVDELTKLRKDFRFLGFNKVQLYINDYIMQLIHKGGPSNCPESIQQHLKSLDTVPNSTWRGHGHIYNYIYRFPDTSFTQVPAYYRNRLYPAEYAIGIYWLKITKTFNGYESDITFQQLTDKRKYYLSEEEQCIMQSVKSNEEAQMILSYY